MARDVHVEFELLKSLLGDFERHIFSGKKHTRANVEVGQQLLDSEDAQRLLSQEFCERLRERIGTVRVGLMKEADDELKQLRK